MKPVIQARPVISGTIAGQLMLDRVLWVRCGGRRRAALAATDVLVRRPGFALIALDTGEISLRVTLENVFRLKLVLRRTRAVRREGTNSPHMKLVPLVCTLAAFLASTVALHAQTWDGGGANDNWSTSANWNPNGVPANDGSAALIFTGTTRLTPVVDTGWSLSGLEFSSTSSGSVTQTASVGRIHAISRAPARTPHRAHRSKRSARLRTRSISPM